MIRKIILIPIFLIICGSVNAMTRLREHGHTYECNECALTGNCSQTYRNTSNKLCLILQNEKPCCCPTNSSCVTWSTDTCLCHPKVVIHWVEFIIIVITVTIVIFLCIYFFGTNNNLAHTNHHSSGYAFIYINNNENYDTFSGDTGDD